MKRRTEQEEPRRYRARAELVLARPDHRPLQTVALDPDPLRDVAAALARVRPGEEADLVVDLLPVSGRAVARRRRRQMRRAAQRGPAAFGDQLPRGSAGAGVGGGVWAGLTGRDAGTGRPAQGVRFSEITWEVGKFTPDAQVFAVQVLIRVEAGHPGRAQTLLQQLMAALDGWTGENWWRPVGPRRSPWRPYSNVPWRRRSFDRRFERGDFAPATSSGRSLVTAREIAGMLKPPTVRCAATNVARCGGVVPAAPAQLPTWTGQSDVLPLGKVSGADGVERLVGVPVNDVLFSAGFGRSGYGKTEQALVQMIARAYSGDGTWLLDPHGAAVSRALPYLTHPRVAGRLQVIRLAHPRMETVMPAVWNPLSMEGRREEEVQEVIGAVVGGISSAQGWGDGAPRARTILASAVRTLAHLSFTLCQRGRPDLQPTIFQVRTLLGDELWREEVLAHMPPQLVRYWRTAFPTYSGEAVSTVTNALDRLDASLSLRAFLGAPRSTYDARRAMDEGRVVLLAPSGTGEADQLITSLLIFDLFRAGLSRQETLDAGEKPRTFWAWIDELTAVDGASRGYVAAILEQLRKYEVRLMAMTQMAMRLSDTTRQALLNNQSVLSAASSDWSEASEVAKRLPGITPETLQGLDRYEYVTSAVVHGTRPSPFLVRGVPVHEVYADHYDPDQVAHVAAGTGEGRTVRELLQVQDGLDDAILDYLTTMPRSHSAVEQDVTVS